MIQVEINCEDPARMERIIKDFNIRFPINGRPQGMTFDDYRFILKTQDRVIKNYKKVGIK